MVSYYTINYQLKDSAGNVLETGSVWGHAINAGSIQYQADYVTREKSSVGGYRKVYDQYYGRSDTFL